MNGPMYGFSPAVGVISDEFVEELIKDIGLGLETESEPLTAEDLEKAAQEIDCLSDAADEQVDEVVDFVNVLFETIKCCSGVPENIMFGGMGEVPSGTFSSLEEEFEEILFKNEGEDNMTEVEEIGIHEVSRLLNRKQEKLEGVLTAREALENQSDINVDVGFLSIQKLMDENDKEEVENIIIMKMEKEISRLEKEIEDIKNGVSFDDKVLEQLSNETGGIL